MRRSSRIAFGLAWLVYLVAVFLAWRRALSYEGNDINALFLATFTCGIGLALVGSWVQDRDRQ